MAITPEVLIAAAEDDGRAEARRRFPSEVRRGLCVAAVLGLVTERQWLAQELEDMPGCADLDTLFVLSGWLVESDGLVGFVDTSAQRTASLHIGFELGTHVTVIRQRLAGQIRQTQQEGGWPQPSVASTARGSSSRADRCAAGRQSHRSRHRASGVAGPHGSTP